MSLSFFNLVLPLLLVLALTLLLLWRGHDWQRERVSAPDDHTPMRWQCRD